MKKYSALLLMMLACVLTWSQNTMEIHLNDTNDSLDFIQIGNNAYLLGDELPSLKEIGKITIIETQRLSKSQCHYVKVGGTNIDLSGKKAMLQKCDSFQLKKPFTLQCDDKIEIYRDTVLCASFLVEPKSISKEEVTCNVKLSLKNANDSILEIKEGESKTIEFVVSNDNKLRIENLRLYCNGDSVDFKKDGSVISVTIEASNVISDYKFELFVDVYGKKNPKNVVLPAVTISCPSNTTWISRLCLIIGIIIGSIALVGLILFLLYWLYWKRVAVMECEDGKKLKVKKQCDKILVGDKANKTGNFKYKGYLIAVGRKKWFDFIPIVNSVMVIVNCDDDKMLYVEPLNPTKDKPYFEYQLSEGKENICCGAIVDGDGEFTVANRYVVCCNNGCIDLIKQIVIDQTTQEKYCITLHGSEPRKGDLIEPAKGKNFVITTFEGVHYDIKSNNRIDKITIEEPIVIIPKKEEPSEKSIETLREELSSAKKKIEELQSQLKSVTQDQIEKQIKDACKAAREDERKTVKAFYINKISNEYVSRTLFSKEKKELERKKNEAVEAQEKLEGQVKIKDAALVSAKKEIEGLKQEKRNQSDEIIQLKALCAKLKDTANKKNMYYLLQVQDALAEISDRFSAVYRNIDNAKIKDGLISPIIKGVSGLSAGILSWKEDFSVKVMGDMESFFGGEFLTMDEKAVKEMIAKKFISNIVKADSFSKFVRLYQLSTVPFVRRQFEDAKMDILTLNRLYYKVFTLVKDFGYTIVCPRLFEEQYSDKKYQWFNATSLFNFIELPDEEKVKVKSLGSETIIDVNQIGFDSQWISRKATAVTPDF